MRIPRGPLTDLLVGLNIVIFLVGWLSGRADQFAVAAGMIPARLTADPFGTAPLPALLTPLSSAFLHADMFHLLFNMLLLLFCGRFVELALGWRLMALLYLIAAYGAGLAQWALDPAAGSVVIGASGAMSGIVAAYMLLFAQAPEKPWGPIPAKTARSLQLLIMWVLINVALGLGGLMGQTVAYGAHIGGFVVGLLLARPLLRFRYRRA